MASFLSPEKLLPFFTSLITSLIATFNSHVHYINSFFDKEPDADSQRTVPEIIESRGFRSESYSVNTEDGYILALHRIINPFAKRHNIDTYPVLLAHGIGAHSGHWLINSDDGHLEPIRDLAGITNGKKGKNEKTHKQISNNLGFLLANMGYDVWLLNWRGSKYSMRHKKLNPRDTKFWDFTVDEMVDYDLPAFIDFIMEKTKKETLGYIGMGQGSNAMFGLLSTNSDYNAKIKPFVAIAPSIKLSNASRIPVPFVKVSVPLPGLLKNPILRVADIALRSTSPGPLPLLNTFGKMIAYVGSGNMFQYHLSRLMNLISSSFVEADVNQDRLTVYAAQTHLCLSKKNAAHLLQTMVYNEFSRFDAGDSENEKMYGDVDPPCYELKNITNRTVAIIHCKHDQYTSTRDIDFISDSMNGQLIHFNSFSSLLTISLFLLYCSTPLGRLPNPRPQMDSFGLLL